MALVEDLCIIGDERKSQENALDIPLVDENSVDFNDPQSRKQSMNMESMVYNDTQYKEKHIDGEALALNDGKIIFKIADEDQMFLQKIEFDGVQKDLNQTKVDIPVDFISSESGINDYLDDSKILQREKIMELEDDKQDEHGDDFDDLEEDLHAGENFWCSLCDDGGKLLFCDGPCLRTFHACLSDRKDHDCKTLGFTNEQYKIIVNAQTWICPNCKTNQQLCFLCHQLGKSISPNQEVFNCHSAHCGQFYHPMCIAQWMTNDKDMQKIYVESIEQNIETFLCPLHTCEGCKNLEDATNIEKKFTKCRRCPRGWHVDCLPKDVPFEKEAIAKNIPQRAWKVELGDEKHHYHVGIYCPKHKLPLRPYDMVKFPYCPDSRFKHIHGTKSFNVGDTRGFIQQKNLNLTLFHKDIHEEKKNQASPRAIRVKLPTVEHTKNLIDETKIQNLADGQKCFGHKQNLELKLRSFKNKNLLKDKARDTDEPQLMSLSDIKKSVDIIILKSKDCKTLEDMKKELCTPSYYTDKNGDKEGKFIHEGELISILNSIPKALNWIKGGRRIDEAKALCPVRSIIQLDRVEKALEAFLNPCLYGQRYTSFGRHFTKKEILIEIVERLQSYVIDKDMIVDFCCGANEFSVELHRKLSEEGKKNCNFKNYDILAPKNEFNFEQRDWFTVQRHELQNGDKLILGLNPPFGKQSALANAFIDQALTFRPKIIILIVPPNTKRLEKYGYELIWADPRLLGGQAFYLPGSISKDIKNTNGTSRFTIGEDWNKNTPPLYLWSRSDWNSDHRQIALQCGHLDISNSNKESQDFSLFYRSKCNLKEFLQQPSNVEKSIKTTMLNGVEGQIVTDTKVSHESRLQSPRELYSTDLKVPILLKEPLKMSMKNNDVFINNGNETTLESRRRRLTKIPHSSLQEAKVKDIIVVQLDEKMVNKNRSGSLNNTSGNEHLKRNPKEETLEFKKSSRYTNDFKIVNESTPNQYEQLKEKKHSMVVNEEGKAIGQEIKPTIGTRSQDNVDKRNVIARSKRARSPDIVDHRDILNFKDKRMNEIISCENRESKRSTSSLRDDKQIKPNLYDSHEDIMHRQRINKFHGEVLHSNKSNAIKQNVEDERAIRIKHGRQDVEQEHVNRINHGRQNIEQERVDRINHEKQDVEQERASRIYRGRQDVRQDVEQERASRIHHGRQNIEEERACRIHYRRQVVEQEHGSRIHHSRQNVEQERSNRIFHGRQDIDKKPNFERDRLKNNDVEMGAMARGLNERGLNERRLNERNNLRYEDSRRNYYSRDMSLKSRHLMNSRDLSPRPRRLIAPQDLDSESKCYRSPQDLSPMSRRMTCSRDIIDQQRLENYDQYNLKNHEDDINRSPEQSKGIGATRAQCMESEPKGITYPKWFTAQTNTGGLGRIESTRSTLLTEIGDETFGRENLKFPSLHGNYGLLDMPTHSQSYQTNYSDLTRDSYTNLHSPSRRFEPNYSNPQEITYMQRDKYETIHGLHNFSNGFNYIDFQTKNYTNETLGTNKLLHSYDHFDGDIGRNYGIDEFSRELLLGNDMPSLSKAMREDPWTCLSQNNDSLASYRNDITHSSITKIGQDYNTKWNTIIPLSPPLGYNQSTLENSQMSSLGNSWNPSTLYSVPTTTLTSFSQREPWSNI